MKRPLRQSRSRTPTENSPLFSKVAILGLGLIGGSIALELKAKGLAKEVLGYNRSRKGREVAKKRKACDQVFAKPHLAVQDADLVILSTPVRNIPLLAKSVFPYLKKGAILTDVGSTKEKIVKSLSRISPKTVFFIGGHPIAGTERSGMEAAQRDLFRDRWWILTPQGKDRPSRRALKKMQTLVKALGAKSKIMSPREHDQILATISHLPHLIAYTLVDTALNFQGGKVLQFAAGGFRDFTRIAASSPEMWKDIAMENSRSILETIRRFQSSLKKLKVFIQQQDSLGLNRFFSRCAEVRRRL